jgi:hypothetical protein
MIIFIPQDENESRIHRNKLVFSFYYPTFLFFYIKNKKEINFYFVYWLSKEESSTQLMLNCSEKYGK